MTFEPLNLCSNMMWVTITDDVICGQLPCYLGNSKASIFWQKEKVCLRITSKSTKIRDSDL